MQQLLKYGDPFFWGVLVPLIVVLVLGLVPYVLPKAKAEELGRWFPRGNRIAQVLVIIITLTLMALTLMAAIR